MKRHYVTGFIFMILAVLLSACGAGNEEGSYSSSEINGTLETYANPDLLADVSWLQEHLDDPSVRIVDMRKEGYESGHIPGAVPITWQDLADQDHEVDGYLLSEEKFETLMGQLGISNDTTVVAYDEGSSLAAARLFFALEYYGHKDKVRVLNGGYQAWLEQGGEVNSEAVNVQPAEFDAVVVEDRGSTFEEVKTLLNSENSENVVILDTRSPAEYQGEDVRAERGGHIPGAVNIEWKQTIRQEGVPYFKSVDELKQIYESNGVTPDKKVVPYCQTNVRGAHTYLTLRLLGYENISPYEGSWAQWGNDPEAPIEK